MFKILNLIILQNGLVKLFGLVQIRSASIVEWINGVWAAKRQD